MRTVAVFDYFMALITQYPRSDFSADCDYNNIGFQGVEHGEDIDTVYCRNQKMIQEFADKLADPSKRFEIAELPQAPDADLD
jgi:hypothetical protein